MHTERERESHLDNFISALRQHVTQELGFVIEDLSTVLIPNDNVQVTCAVLLACCNASGLNDVTPKIC